MGLAMSGIQRCRLLCIEPAAATRALLTALGEQHGWQVELAADFSADLFKDEAPDLVLTAAEFPSGTYADVVRLVRAHPDGEAIPVVLLTGDQVQDNAQSALEGGITEVFSRQDLPNFGAYLDTVMESLRLLPEEPSRRALVLDDERSVAFHTAVLLADLGLMADCVHNFEDAQARIQSTHYDLIVVDVILGSGPTGNQFVRLLRQVDGSTRRTPTIVVSGFSDSARRLDAMRAGADAFLTKPLQPTELAFHVRKLLQIGAPEDRHTGACAHNLSRREQDICVLVATGLSDKAIADRLGISYWTVRSHIASIFRKCQVMNRVELVGLLRRPESCLPETLSEAVSG